MNIPLVKKIRKPILVMGVVVAMASLLFTLGDTTNQARAATKDATNRAQAMWTDFNDVMSMIDDQRVQSYQTLLNLQTRYPSYYGPAGDYYDTYIAPNVNQWIDSLNTEGQSNEPLNNSNDQPTITKAITANFQLNAWANEVAEYTSSGLTPPDSSPAYASSQTDPDKLREALNKLGDGFGYFTGDCIQQIRDAERWQQLKDLQSSQQSSQPLPQCQPLQLPQPSDTSQPSGTSQPSDTSQRQSCFLWWC
jgi:hypothetical protein